MKREGESSAEGDNAAPEHILWDTILPSKTLHHEYSIVFVFLKINTLIEEEGYYKVENGVIL